MVDKTSMLFVFIFYFFEVCKLLNLTCFVDAESKNNITVVSLFWII